MLRWQLSTCVCFHSLSTNERSILSCSSSGTLLFVTIGYHEKYPRHVNSLAPRSYDSDFKSEIFKLIIQNNSLGTHCEFALRWMPHNLPNQSSTLIQVMAWCQQATSHYLSQCWPRCVDNWGGLNKIPNILQMTFWNARSWIFFFNFSLDFTEVCS